MEAVISECLEILREKEKMLVTSINVAPFPIMFLQPCLSGSFKLKILSENDINQNKNPVECKAKKVDRSDSVVVVQWSTGENSS